MMVLMVQKEVAERICAKPGEMSLLSVAVQLYSKAEYIMAVSKDYFWPTPQVNSAIIKLDQIKIPSDINQEKFFHVVKAGFSSRRKMLIKNLLPLVGKDQKAELQTIFKEVGLSEKVRAQELSVGQWKSLVRKIEI
jgi:16S rRNA (adenine1518-N6/adenine1519-N6)-dimethyltransferase